MVISKREIIIIISKAARLCGKRIPDARKTRMSTSRPVTSHSFPQCPTTRRRSVKQIEQLYVIRDGGRH